MRKLAVLLPAFAFSLFCAAQTAQPGTPGHKYYVDCGATAGDGSSPRSPWNTLSEVNTRTFSAGDTVLLRRGSECHGVLTPRGSGVSGDSIRVTAYGDGPRPRVIAPASAEEALLLFNQQYWQIDSLDLSGSKTYGVYVNGDKGVLHHIYLRNLTIHDVSGGEMKHKESGLLVFSQGNADQHFDDVLIDGVTAWHTGLWAGILVGGGNLGFPPEADWNTNVVIRNSAIHDVQGDGIVLFRVRQGVIENSVAWNTGMQVTESMGTPNAIWTWMCHSCTVRHSEAFLTDSPGVDGGAFDIDYGNTDNSVLDNYGHETQGYCVAVFGAGFVTHQSVVRGNLCINNGRSPRMADYQGAIFLLSWNNGSIDGLAIEKNTVYWNPFEDAPPVMNNATIRAGSAIFRDNAIYATSESMIDSNAALRAADNHYSYYGSVSPRWRFGAEDYNGLAPLQQQAQQETGSQLARHPLKDWHAALAPPPTASLPRFSVSGVFAQNWKSMKQQPYRISAGDGQWHLYAAVPASLDSDGLLSSDALSQIVPLRSVANQYAASGLVLTLLLECRGQDLGNALGDLDLHGAEIAEASTGGAGKDLSRTVLVTPDGRIAGQWEGYAGPAELGLVMRRWMGEPVYSQMGTQR